MCQRSALQQHSTEFSNCDRVFQFLPPHPPACRRFRFPVFQLRLCYFEAPPQFPVRLIDKFPYAGLFVSAMIFSIFSLLSRPYLYIFSKCRQFFAPAAQTHNLCMDGVHCKAYLPVHIPNARTLPISDWHLLPAEKSNMLRTAHLPGSRNVSVFKRICNPLGNQYRLENVIVSYDLQFAFFHVESTSTTQHSFSLFGSLPVLKTVSSLNKSRKHKT